jgi:ribosome-binding factor A
MASNRQGRINEEMQKELTTLIQGLKDPRVQETMVSVIAVRATPDLRWAKVYVSVLDEQEAADVMKGLKSAGGWLRRELGSRLQLRYTPELVLELDDSIQYGAKISALLNKLVAQDEKEEN